MALYFVEFVILSLAGWVYECTYCTVRTGEWQNRGFLYGPICPIYGAGAVGAIIIAHHFPALFNPDSPGWRVFCITAALSAVLEYATSWVLERLFHAVWWDYHDMPLNLNGRICLPATTLFGLAGLVIVKLLVPLETELAAHAVPLLCESLSLVLAFAVGIDTGLTVDGLIRLGERLDLMQEEFDTTMEHRVQLLKGAPAALSAQAHGAEQELSAVVERHRRSLSTRQRYLLHSMRYRSRSRRTMAQQIKSGLGGVKKRLEYMQKEYEDFRAVNWEDYQQHLQSNQIQEAATASTTAPSEQNTTENREEQP